MADGKARLLVVDDRAEGRARLARALAGAGYRVATAPDGAAGLAMALYAPPDLVLTDLQLPRLDGAALCQRLMATSQTRGVRVVVATGLPAAAAAARLAGCPPDALVEKRDGFDAVLRAVAAALATEGRASACGQGCGSGRRAGTPTPDALLQRYPRETLLWLRGWLGLSQRTLAAQVAVRASAVAAWEARRRGISSPYRERLATLLAPHLATPEGEAFAQSLGRREAPTLEN